MPAHTVGQAHAGLSEVALKLRQGLPPTTPALKTGIKAERAVFDLKRSLQRLDVKDVEAIRRRKTDPERLSDARDPREVIEAALSPVAILMTRTALPAATPPRLPSRPPAKGSSNRRIRFAVNRRSWRSHCAICSRRVQAEVRARGGGRPRRHGAGSDGVQGEAALLAPVDQGLGREPDRRARITRGGACPCSSSQFPVPSGAFP